MTRTRPKEGWTVKECSEAKGKNQKAKAGETRGKEAKSKATSKAASHGVTMIPSSIHS